MARLKAENYRAAADRFDKTLLAKVNRGGVQELGVGELAFKEDQPRKHVDERELAALAASVREEGVKNPLHVRKKPGGGFEVLAGERRLRAARLAGLERVPVIVHDLGDEEARKLAVLDNLHRADLNPIEETEAVLALVESALGVGRDEAVLKLRAAANVLKGRTQESLSEEEQRAIEETFARYVGRLTVLSFVQARLPLLELPEALYRAVLGGKIAYTVALPLRGIEDERRRSEVLARAVGEGLTRDEVVKLVREADAPPVSVRKLEAQVKPARRFLGIEQLKRVPPDKRGDFVKLVEEFAARAGALLDLER